MIQNIVFDFGGVIASICRDRAVHAFMQLGLADADSRLDKYHQTGIFQELEEGKLSDDGFCTALSSLCGRKLTWKETQQAWLGFFTGVNLTQLAYLTELRKNYRIYVLSNTNPFVMSWACSADFTPLKKPLTDYCDKLYLSYEIGYTKPAREIFDFMVKDSGITPAETLFVDDGASNIAIGRQLGFATFQPENGEDAREIFDFMVKDSGITPAETLFVDDGASNIAIGRQLGFATFQPENGEEWTKALSEQLNLLNSLT